MRLKRSNQRVCTVYHETKRTGRYCVDNILVVNVQVKSDVISRFVGLGEVQRHVLRIFFDPKRKRKIGIAMVFRNTTSIYHIFDTQKICENVAT